VKRKPPSTGTIAPLIQLERPLTKKRITLTTSSGFPNLPRGSLDLKYRSDPNTLKIEAQYSPLHKLPHARGLYLSENHSINPKPSSYRILELMLSLGAIIPILLIS